MRWIIVSSNPAALQACLEAGQKHLHNQIPIVIPCPMPAPNSEEDRGYIVATSRFRLIWLGAEFRQAMETAVGSLRENSTLEPTTLITTDTMLLTRTLSAREANAALTSDSNLLAMDLIGQVSDDCGSVSCMHPKGCGPYYTVPMAGPPSPFGAFYRTGDLLAAFHNSSWNSPATLKDAFSRDSMLFRRTRVGMWPEPSIQTHHQLSGASIHKYLAGEVVDIARLDGGELRWRAC